MRRYGPRTWSEFPGVPRFSPVFTRERLICAIPRVSPRDEVGVARWKLLVVSEKIKSCRVLFSATRHGSTWSARNASKLPIWVISSPSFRKWISLCNWRKCVMIRFRRITNSFFGFWAAYHDPKPLFWRWVIGPLQQVHIFRYFVVRYTDNKYREIFILILGLFSQKVWS